MKIELNHEDIIKAIEEYAANRSDLTGAEDCVIEAYRNDIKLPENQLHELKLTAWILLEDA